MTEKPRMPEDRHSVSSGRIVECVPNFSEGRDRATVDAIVDAISRVEGVVFLDREMDADHNRSVLTFAGEPDAVVAAAFLATAEAARRIDLTKHQGAHPRMGATDVVPFVPVRGVTTADCVALAERLGQRIGEELSIPVFLYGDAARRPERRNLADVRKGQFEGLRDLVGKDPARRPDFGPDRIHPTAGATAVGARFFLIAYNVNLASHDVALAKSIAKAIREKDGGLPGVRALGLDLADRKLAQVSMNLVDFRQTSMATVYREIEARAKAAGVDVLESEIIGLVPGEAMRGFRPEDLKLARFDPSAQVIESRL
jgi:glutamate formiminotransferase